MVNTTTINSNMNNMQNNMQNNNQWRNNRRQQPRRYNERRLPDQQPYYDNTDRTYRQDTTRNQIQCFTCWEWGHISTHCPRSLKRKTHTLETPEQEELKMFRDREAKMKLEKEKQDREKELRDREEAIRKANREETQALLKTFAKTMSEENKRRQEEETTKILESFKASRNHVDSFALSIGNNHRTPTKQGTHGYQPSPAFRNYPELNLNHNPQLLTQNTQNLARNQRNHYTHGNKRYADNTEYPHYPQPTRRKIFTQETTNERQGRYLTDLQIMEGITPLPQRIPRHHNTRYPNTQYDYPPPSSSSSSSSPLTLTYKDYEPTQDIDTPTLPTEQSLQNNILLRKLREATLENELMRMENRVNTRDRPKRKRDCEIEEEPTETTIPDKNQNKKTKKPTHENTELLPIEEESPTYFTKTQTRAFHQFCKSMEDDDKVSIISRIDFWMDAYSPCRLNFWEQATSSIEQKLRHLWLTKKGKVKAVTKLRIKMRELGVPEKDIGKNADASWTTFIHWKTAFLLLDMEE